MPIHDWTKVDAGIFHAFHVDWIYQFAHVLNHGLLPDDYYALPEQVAGKYEPDVLTLQGPPDPEGQNRSGGGGVLTAPKLKPVADTDLASYRRKQKVVGVRHVSDDGLVALIEIVSPGNKSSRKALSAFTEKAVDLLSRQIHQLVVDLHPTSALNPQGIHGLIWEDLSGQAYVAPKDKPFTLAAYEATERIFAYVEHVAVGDALPSMPLFLQPQKAVDIPLEATYNAAFAEIPRRWRRVLEPNVETNGVVK